MKRFPKDNGHVWKKQIKGSPNFVFESEVRNMISAQEQMVSKKEQEQRVENFNFLAQL
jgi:hypothetical protein